jgi:hypothetical protein
MLRDLLQTRGFESSLAPGRTAVASSAPADRIVVRGRVTVEELFHTLAKARFGEKKALRASIFEHGADHLGIEILDSTAKPARPPVVVVQTTTRPAPSPPPGPQPVPAPVLRAVRETRPLELEFNLAYMNATRGPDTRREE